MSKTKTKILAHSLKLFNEKGITDVSLRAIANDMNISVGNLQYHFKKREDIILQLYFQLVETIDKKMLEEAMSENILMSFFNISKTMMVAFFEYRFFLLDFNMIIREHSQIKNHYQQLTKLRKQQFFELLKVLIQQGLMRSEKLENEYENLFKRIQILSDFWLSSAFITSKKMSEEIVDEYLQVIKQTVFPYLTEKGNEEFLKL